MAIKLFQASAMATLLVANLSCTSGNNPDESCTVHPDSNNQTLPGDGYGNKSLQLSWEKPTLREEGLRLKYYEIDSYLLVIIPQDRITAYYDQMYSIDPDNFTKIPAGLGIYLPQASIPKLAASSLPYTLRVKCLGETKFLAKRMKSGMYYMAIVTIDTQKQYSNLSKTISVKIDE